MSLGRTCTLRRSLFAVVTSVVLYSRFKPRNIATASASLSGATDTSDTMSLQASKVIGDVFDKLASSKSTLSINFAGAQVNDGVQLTPKQASKTPTVVLSNAEPSGLYTLIASDPDAPDPQNPIRGEWLHWLVTNIPGSGNVAYGNEIIPYMGPAPPIGTHRYVFMLFQQPNEEPLQVSNTQALEKRANFKTRQFTKEHNLGDPVFATYFLSHK